MSSQNPFLFAFFACANGCQINEPKLIEKEFKDVEKLIDFEIIHAKRSVASSEENNGSKVLSKLTTDYFNHSNTNAPDKFETINALISEMDDKLGGSYETFFSNFLSNAKDFLSMNNLRVISNLKAKEIVKDSSEVVCNEDILITYLMPIK